MDKERMRGLLREILFDSLMGPEPKKSEREMVIAEVEEWAIEQQGFAAQRIQGSLKPSQRAEIESRMQSACMSYLLAKLDKLKAQSHD